MIKVRGGIAATVCRLAELLAALNDRTSPFGELPYVADSSIAFACLSRIRLGVQQTVIEENDSPGRRTSLD